MKTILLLCLVSLSAFAQSRTVSLSWVPSPSSGVTGYNVYRSTTASDFSQSVGTFRPLNASPVAATNFSDSTAVIGQTYTYAVTAVAAGCTASTPIATPCGEGAYSTPATVPIPPRPAVTVTVTVTVN